MMTTMRIVGGTLAGRRLCAPTGQATRPTSDRVREAIFNRLAHAAFSDEDPFVAAVLDLYAGAGGLGLEALSRGAPRCDFVDSSPAACAAIRRNLDDLGLSERARVHQLPIEAFLRRATMGPYGLVFADPPYADAGAPLSRALARLCDAGHLSAQALIVVEHGEHAVPDAPSSLRALDRRRYGQTVTSFFAPATHGISEGT
jgi:16S rRNA (guanine966-N2)-methyltransferase